MTGKLKKIVIGVVALAALGLGGAALAGATSGGDDAEGAGPVSSADAACARAAAVAETGGKAGHIERDGEKGATYEVEVAKPDGTQVDVRLDERFKVVVVDSDSEGSGRD